MCVTDGGRRVARGVESASGIVPGASLPVPQVVPPHPGSSSAQVSARMSQASRRDTQPEIRVRRLLHAQGLRYRVAYPFPGYRRRTIDIAFTRVRIAVFIDGCFWHGCPEHGTRPRANSDWWATKITANRSRDEDSTRLLIDLGWEVLRFWEHQDPEEAVQVIASAYARRSTARTNVVP